MGSAAFGLDEFGREQVVQRARSYLQEVRKIPGEVCMREGVQFLCHQHRPVIRFPVFRANGEPIGAHFRSVDERGFFCQPGTPSIVSPIHRLDQKLPYAIVVEGDIDRLSFLAAGIGNVLALPGISNSQRSIEPYLLEDRFWEAIRGKTLICATDADDSGDKVARDIQMLTGSLHRLRFSGGVKDANEFLVRFGREALFGEFQAFLEGKSLVGPDTRKLVEGALLASESTIGLSAGCIGLDQMFTWAPPQLVAMTGYAGLGKSTFFDWLAARAFELHNWRTVFCSFETTPADHLLRMAACLHDLPQFAKETKRKPTRDQLLRAAEQVVANFGFVDFVESQHAPTLENVLCRCGNEVKRLDARILIIDPWNGLDPCDRNLNENLWIAKSLSEMRLMAQRLNLVIVVVAHPTKPIRGRRLECPTGHDISGSAAWSTKCDIGLSMHREDIGSNLATLSMWKLRNHYWASKRPARTALMFECDPDTGRYSVPDLKPDSDFVDRVLALIEQSTLDAIDEDELDAL